MDCTRLAERPLLGPGLRLTGVERDGDRRVAVLRDGDATWNLALVRSGDRWLLSEVVVSS